MTNLFELLKNLAFLSEEIIMYSRKQNYNKASRIFAEWVSTVSATAKEIVSLKPALDPDGSFAYESQLVMILKEILSAQENQDYLLVADMMEVNLIPFIFMLQNSLLNLNSNDNNTCVQNNTKIKTQTRRYEVETTSMGADTLKITTENESFYMCGNVNPYRDAALLFDQYKVDDADSYIIFGLELGYLIYAIERSIGNAVPVTVYESDSNIIEIAKKYRHVQNAIEGKGNFRIIYDNDYSKFSEAISKKTDKDILIIHHPSVRNISNASIREKMESLFVEDSSIRNQIVEILANFKSNTKVCNHYVDELKACIEDRDVFVVAAGPSLDNNIDLLKERPENTVILCVGRAYKKMMEAGISPDYVVFLDAAERIYGQFRNFTESSVPLILVSSACKNIGLTSKADKYLLCQKGLKEAENFAKANNYSLYNTGGSVTTVAFDLAISLGAKRVITLGLDLSYKDGKTHASGSFSKSIGDESGLISVTGQMGEKLYTTKAMDMYRIWFEDRIKNAQSSGAVTEFVNATEGGVNIKGMKNMKLKDAIR